MNRMKKDPTRPPMSLNGVLLINVIEAVCSFQFHSDTPASDLFYMV